MAELNKYKFAEVVSIRGGRMMGKVKLGEGEGRKFVVLEISCLLDDREVVGVQKALAAGKNPYVNLGYGMVDLRGDAEMIRRLIKVAEECEAKLDAAALSHL